VLETHSSMLRMPITRRWGDGAGTGNSSRHVGSFWIRLPLASVTEEVLKAVEQMLAFLAEI